VFVAIQISLSLVLVSGAALTLKSFDRLVSREPGVELENALALRVTLPWERYEGKTTRFYEEWLSETGEIPGVRAAGLVTQFPPMVFMQSRLGLEHRNPASSQELFTTYDTIASAGIFDALGMKLVRGRLFEDRETASASPEVVVNESLAARFFPNEDPIGRRIQVAQELDEAPWLTIVGVVADARNRGVDRAASPEVWRSYRQHPWVNQLHLLVRTEGEPTSFVPAVRERLRALDPDLSAYDIQSLEQRFDSLLFTRRFTSYALAALASLALALAGMGLYGVIAFSVGERRRELGLRIALGADSTRLVRHVLRDALTLVGLGVGVGIGAAFAVARFLAGMLFQVAPHDPASMIATVALVLAVAFSAALIPARRATRVDPAESLR
jgi:predicted permease